jgi:hypothetical protein
MLSHADAPRWNRRVNKRDTELHNRIEYCVIGTLISVSGKMERRSVRVRRCGTPISLSGKMERRSVRVRRCGMSAPPQWSIGAPEQSIRISPAPKKLI